MALRANAAQAPLVMTGLVPAPMRRAARNSGADAVPLPQQLAALDETARQERMLALVRAGIAGVLGHADADGGTIGPDQPLSTLGLDSLTSVELRNRLGDTVGTRLPGSLIYDHPTPRSSPAICWTWRCADRTPWTPRPGPPWTSRRRSGSPMTSVPRRRSSGPSPTRRRCC
ncbi:acyl carrier protein [Streptomyces nogalater]